MHLDDRPVFRRRLIDNRLKSIWIRDRTQGHNKSLRAQEILKLVDESDGHCPLCHCELLFEKYAPGCDCAFSIDRVNRDRPHSADNVRLTCLRCNVRPSQRRRCPCHPEDA